MVVIQTSHGDAALMRRYPVSKRVNLVTNDDPECSAPGTAPVIAVEQ
jgi:hypothetical protein